MVMGNETEINIILDESDPPNPIFVEIENKHGMSIRIGERTIRADGLTALKITAMDITNHKAT